MRFPGAWRTRGAAIIAAMMLFASPARAGCSPEDLAKGFLGTVAATWDCKSVCKSEEACAAAVALDLILGAIAVQGSDTGKGQALVNQFCAEAKVKGEDLVATANTIFGNQISQKLLGDLSDQLAAIGSAVKVVECSCETEQSTSSMSVDLGKCFEDVMCGVFKVGCNCTRPPPQTANCTSIDVKKCKEDHSYSGIWNPACIPVGSMVYGNPNWLNGTWDTSSSVAKAESPEGTLAILMPPTHEGTGCAPVQSCFCPKPMVPVWHHVPNPDGDNLYVFSCDCPYEADNPDHQTHPGPWLVKGISQCLCDNTGQPANFGFAPFGMCPPAACPAGQTRLPNGECVTPCSDPTQGMAFDGSCCNPTQMTSCGQCCPPATIPDPKSGTCVPKQIVK